MKFILKMVTAICAETLEDQQTRQLEPNTDLMDLLLHSQGAATGPYPEQLTLVHTFIPISKTYLNVILPRDFFTLDFMTRILYAFLMSSMRTTRPTKFYPPSCYHHNNIR